MNVERMKELYEAARRHNVSRANERTFEEWCERVSDYGLDDAEQSLLQDQQDRAEFDKGAEAMKEACIEVTKVKADMWWRTQYDRDDSALIRAKADAGFEIISAIQSVTLEGRENNVE